jgi:hypothetical protein
MSRIVRSAVAGAAAAGAWAAAEPLIARALRTPYSDVRLLGRTLTRGRLWPVAGLAVHVGNGAAFGATFAALGRGGVRDGVVAAQLENAALWPAMAVMERIHPDVRSGRWPRLFLNPRVAGHAFLTHMLFGLVLGALTARD